MARWRQAVELATTDEDIEKLTAIARSRSEAARRVERAQILLVCREKSSFFAVGQRLGLHHQTVQRCVERALAYGPLTALDGRPRPGKGCKVPSRSGLRIEWPSSCSTDPLSSSAICAILIEFWTDQPKLASRGRGALKLSRRTHE